MAMATSLTTSLLGMKTAQGQIDIIGRNIANIDTVGYTRKTAQQNNVVMAGHPSGVALGDIRRSVNEGLLKSFLASNSTSGNLSAKSEYLNKADILLGTPIGDNSIAANMASLQTSFSNFAADVTSAANRYGIVRTADSLTSRVNSLTSEIQKLRGDADIAIGNSVNDINHILDEIDTLNDSVVKYTVLGYDGVPDLLDKRDQALRELSNLIDISYFTRENGELVIQTKEGVQLLDRDPHYLSHNSIAQASPATTYPGGGIAGIFVDGQDITKLIRDGELKGLISIRDDTLVSLQAQLDEMTGVLKDNINQIHNQGTSFPQGSSKLVGERCFIDSAVQQISIEDGDVRLVIFDASGKQAATTTLGAGLGFTAGTVDNMTAAINTWLSSPAGANLPQGTAYIDTNGNLVIDTGDSNYTVSMIDEVSTTPGSSQTDVTIKFDVNGDGSFDRSASGFSNFFKMNDFFSTNLNESILDTKVMDRNAKLGVTGVVELEFSDMVHGIGYGSCKIFSNDNLQSIADRINNDQTLGGNITATIVPNGNGVMLRLMNADGEQIEINEKSPSTGFLDRIGLKPSYSGAAGEIHVRSDLRTAPGLISAGSPKFNFSTGEYEIDSGINNVANKMAGVFSETVAFSQSGGISATQTTLANYAATFVGVIASSANAADADLEYQAELTNSIATKEAEVSGVDMDEELGQLILFQQTYAACAKSFTAAKEMLDMLLSIV